MPRISVIFLCLVIQIYLILEDKQQKYFRCHQISKKTYAILDDIGHQ